ncbi:MAG: VWA domain-containing protein [Gemmataceae bacterium]
MAAAAAPGGTVTPLPRPADVLSVVKRLPILELPEAELKEVQVVNVTTKQPAFKVDLRPDGAFEALVPAALVPWDKHRTNLLEATAIAKDDVSKATDRVTIRGVLPWAKVRILYRGKEGRDTLPLPLLPAVDFILDSSGSMSLPVGDQPKYVIARNVMRDLLSELPRELQVGLRVYGHLGFWRKDGKLLPGAPRNDDPRWCSDSQLVVPIAPVTPKQIAAVKTWVEQVEPFGMTPLVHSLLEARRDFPAGLTAPKMVILISDGKETCGGNLDDVEKAYKDPAIKMVVHVVGFDIEGKDSIAQRNLERLALIGGGRYFKAENAADLAKVLRSAVQATGYVVSSADGKTVVGRGVINGPALELLPGRYQVQLAGGKAAPMTIVLEDNDVRALTLDDAGKLAP